MNTLIVNRVTISIVLVLISFCFITEATYGDVTISEIMYGSEIRFSPKQWIEISNTGTEPINIAGWTLTIQNVDSEDLLGPVTATINFRDATFEDAPRIWPNDFLLIVTSDTDDNSGGFMEDQVYDLRWREDLDIGFNTTWLSAGGFYITLTDKDGNLIDEVGNYDGNTTLWDLPYSFNRGRIRAGNRTSLIRRYSNGTALDGTQEDSWVSAADASLTEEQKTYYGHENDISSVGIGPTAAIQRAPEPMVEESESPMMQGTSSPITISEVMYGSEIRFSPKQWIEIYNSGTEAINLTGWTLTIQNVDSDDLLGPVTATINFRDATFEDAPRIWPNDFLLIVTSDTDDNSGGFMEDQVYDLRWREDLDIGFNTTWLSAEGFYITLTDKDGNLVDEVGNYDGNTTLWDLPYNFNRGRTRDGRRTSIMRCYVEGVALDGTQEYGWVSAVDANLSAEQLTHYGDENDISSSGIGIINNPKTFEIISGDAQQDAPGTALENPLVVEVRDQCKNPLPDVEVTFSVASGAGVLSRTSVMTDNNGRAESSLTLGPNLGTNTVTVSITRIQGQQTFNAEGIRIPKTFEVISGDDQRDTIGTALPQSFVVEVRDQYDEPLPDVEVTFSVTGGGGTLSGTSAMTDVNGRAESTLTLGTNPGPNTVTVSVAGIQEEQTITAVADPPPIPQDVNKDGVVNILDLVSVASALEEEGQGLVADVNGDGIVNILDLVSVAGALEGVAAAPSSNPRALVMLNAADVEQWLAQAQTLDLTDATSRRGVLFLEQLLAALTPKQTALLPNYPNPFNPETWIPYHLAEDADVTLTIYDSSGRMVRQLRLGHRLAGYYADRGKAAYWDGRNGYGEQVASGVYFYLLSAGDFSAARKMLIRK